MPWKQRFSERCQQMSTNALSHHRIAIGSQPFLPPSCFQCFRRQCFPHIISLSNGASFTMFSCKIRSQRTSVCGKLVSMSSSVSSASSASVRFLSCRCSQMSALHTLMHAACHTPLQLFSFFLLGELCNALSSAPVKQLKCVIACRQQKLAVCFLFPVFLMFLDVFDVCAWYIAHRT